MKTIYFIRHAQTEALVAGILAGSELDTPLTELGKEQAAEAGRFLKHKAIELIVHSPLKRTTQTAEIIALEIGLSASRVIPNKLIIERNFGNYDGRPYEEYTAARAAGTLDDSPEPTESLHKRVLVFFDWLAARPEKTILVVSHGATGRMFRAVDQEVAHNDYHHIKQFAPAEIDEFTI